MMETLKREEADTNVKYTLGHTIWRFGKQDYSRMQMVLDCLLEYQKTGLEPDEIRKIKVDAEAGYLKQAARRYGVPVDRLQSLAQADRDGRLVVLPCKVGDTVYEPNKRGFISTYKVISIHLSTCSILVGWELIDGIYSNVNGFEASALGKTVFLTRKEAEAELEGGEW